MATGKLPFRGETSAVIFDAIISRRSGGCGKPEPDLPARLEEVIKKALEKDPRFATNPPPICAPICNA